ncbi:NUDIX hydrolase [Conyzicola lurida]
MLSHPAATIRADLLRWTPADPAQAALRTEYVAFVDAGGDAALDRSGGPEHLTASCFVLTPDLSSVLLCFHRKGQFWVQLGGHIEPGDPDVASAAFREALEESGIADLTPLGRTPLDVDRHALPGAFGSCAVHWDLGFVALAPADAVPVTSHESEDVAWWPVDALPPSVPPGFGRRLAGILTALAALPAAPTVGNSGSL